MKSLWMFGLVVMLMVGHVGAQDAEQGVLLTPTMVFDLPTQISEHITSMEFCPQWDCLIYVDERHQIFRVDLSHLPDTTITHTASLPVGVDTVEMSVSPDGLYVRLFIPGQQGTFVWDLDSNEIFNIPNEVRGVDAEGSYGFPRSYWHQIGATQYLVLDNPLYYRGEIWNLKTRQVVSVARQTPHWLNETRFVTFYPDGSVFLWDAETGEQLLEIATGNRIEEIFIDSTHSHVYVSNLTDTNSWKTDLTVWDLETGAFLFAFREIYTPHWVVLSHDASQVFIGNEDDTWTLWDTETQTQVFQIESASSYPMWNADETLIMTDYAAPPSSPCHATYETQLTCEHGSLIWDAQTGKLLSQHPDPLAWYRGPSWMRNGQWFLQSTETGFMIWDAQTGDTLYMFDAPEWGFLSDDETRFLAYTEGRLYFWSIPQP